LDERMWPLWVRLEALWLRSFARALEDAMGVWITLLEAKNYP